MHTILQTRSNCLGIQPSTRPIQLSSLAFNFIVIFLLIIQSDSEQCKPINSLKLDNRTHLSTYIIPSQYSPLKKQQTIYLFTDALLKRKSRIQETTDILHLVNEPQLIILLKYYMENTGVYIHVGAGTAIQDIILSKYIESKQWQTPIYLIEPEPFTYILLVKNLYLNGLNSLCHVSNVAAGQKTNEKANQLNVKLGDISSSEVIEETATKIRADYKVNVSLTSLDDLYQKIQTNINFVYLDNDMMTIQTLLGMKEILKRNQGISVLMDWNYGASAHRFVEQFIEMYQLLEELGFKFYWIILEGDSGRISRFEEIKGFQKIFLVKKGKLLILNKIKALPPMEIFY